MIKTEIKSINNYDYVLSDNKNNYHLNLEFYDLDNKLNIGDIIYIPKKLLKDNLESKKDKDFSECKECQVEILQHIVFEYEIEKLSNIIKDEDDSLDFSLQFKNKDTEPFENIFKKFL